MGSEPYVPECGRYSVDVNCTTGATFTKGPPPVYVPSERVWMAVGVLLQKIGNCGLDLDIVGPFERNEELVWHERFCSCGRLLRAGVEYVPLQVEPRMHLCEFVGSSLQRQDCITLNRVTVCQAQVINLLKVRSQR